MKIGYIVELFCLESFLCSAYPLFITLVLLKNTLSNRALLLNECLWYIHNILADLPDNKSLYQDEFVFFVKFPGIIRQLLFRKIHEP